MKASVLLAVTVRVIDMYSVFYAKLISDNATLNDRVHVFARKLSKINETSDALATLRQAREFASKTYRKYATRDAKIAHDIDVDSIVFFRNVADKSEAIELKAALQGRFDSDKQLSERERKLAVASERVNDVKRKINTLLISKATERSAALHAQLTTTEQQEQTSESEAA